jgi:hypothetical protein
MRHPAKRRESFVRDIVRDQSALHCQHTHRFPFERQLPPLASHLILLHSYVRLTKANLMRSLYSSTELIEHE